MPVRNKVVKVLQMDRESISHRLLQTIITFLLFAFSGIFFRADNLKDAAAIVAGITAMDNPWILFDGGLYSCGLDEKNFRLMLCSILLLFLADFLKYRGTCIRKIIMKQEWWFRILIMAGSILFILLVGIWGSAYNEAGFIYFQF